MHIVDAHAHFPNMHRATFYHNMLCILFVHFGTFSIVGIEMYKNYYLYTVVNSMSKYVCMYVFHKRTLPKLSIMSYVYVKSH